MEAWKFIFPVTPVSIREGFLPLTDPVWMEWDHPWWIFPSDKPTKAEARIFGWRALSPLSLERSLSVSSQVEDITERIVWIAETGVVRCWGNEISKAVVRIVPHFFNLLVNSREQPMEILEHLLTIVEGVELPRKQLREMGWRCLLRSKNLYLHEAKSMILSNFPMNIVFWNCRGALNPRFHSVLLDLLNRHSPTIVVVMETRVGGERAKAITERLLFDGAIHADTIGYSGGL